MATQDIVINEVTFVGLSGKDVVEQTLLSGEWHEEQNLQFIRELGCEGVYIDVGAHIGSFSLYFAKLCNAYAVLAIEPDPWAFNHLCDNIKANNCYRIFPMRAALSDACDFVQMARYPNGHLGFSEDPSLPTRRTFRLTLDSLALAECDVLKLSVEGHEPEALLGASKTLRRLRPHVFVEVWPASHRRRHALRPAKKAVFEFMESIGYTLGASLPENLHYFRPRSRP